MCSVVFVVFLTASLSYPIKRADVKKKAWRRLHIAFPLDSVTYNYDYYDEIKIA